MSRRPNWWHAALGFILLLALALRLQHIHTPLLDHPGWRQGDTAAIARNFATIEYNVFHPQADYDGPPPNYVELELQIVPFLAATLYKIFGVHEIFGRLITLGFSLVNVGLVAYFARWLFGESVGDPDARPASRMRSAEIAGLAGAFLFAVYPGAVYYGRTFTPDAAMVCLLTAALYACSRWIVSGGATWRGFWLPAVLMALAILAKPVAIVGLVPVAAMLVARLGRRAFVAPQTWALFSAALVPYLAYDAYLRTIAEWHWASGITTKHVLPDLAASFASLAAFRHKFGSFGHALAMLPATLLGPFGTALFGLAVVVPPLSDRAELRVNARSRALLFGWLAAMLAYAFVVVTVERVDYYLLPILPLAALWTGGFVARWSAVAALLGPPARILGSVAGAALLAIMVWSAIVVVRPYYHFNTTVFQRAKALDATLAPGALVVQGHYDPSVLYYINRKGWEEDPYLWTPFDEESAIRKGARYFIAIEPRRLARNVELCHWLERFPLLDPNAAWPVYVTDPARTLPGAEARWRAFRRVELAGKARPCRSTAAN